MKKRFSIKDIVLIGIPVIIIAIIAGRILANILYYVLTLGFGFQMKDMANIEKEVLRGLPGIAIQLVLILLTVYALKKMNKKFSTKDLVLTGLLLALGILMPMFFHLFGGTGPVFLPMHIPVLIGGFVLPPFLALLLGIVTPLVSSVLTGMPIIFPMGLIMVFELGIYGLVASLATRKLKLPSIPALILAMIAGRVVAGIVIFALSLGFGIQMNAIAFVKTAVLTGLPGIAIQIIFIPSLMRALNKVIRSAKINA
ncbi:MAG: ECF transporter S component [Tissierellales bacterium]